MYRFSGYVSSAPQPEDPLTKDLEFLVALDTTTENETELNANQDGYDSHNGDKVDEGIHDEDEVGDEEEEDDPTVVSRDGDGNNKTREQPFQISNTINLRIKKEEQSKHTHLHQLPNLNIRLISYFYYNQPATNFGEGSISQI